MEFEWTDTISYMRTIADHPDIHMHWYQVPFDCNSAGSLQADIRYWDDRTSCKAWVREKEPDSIHSNPFFKGQSAGKRKGGWNASLGNVLIGQITGSMAYRYGSPVVSLIGLRASESPKRRRIVTRHPGYKWITWLKGERSKYLDTKIVIYNGYPIYDWRDQDIWRAIGDNEWPYCDLYDRLWQDGYQVRAMRLSSLIHEGAILNLGEVRKIDPVLWNAMLERLPSLHSAERNNLELLLPEASKLPPVFDDWHHYRRHMLTNLIDDARLQGEFRRVFARPSMDDRFLKTPWENSYMRECCLNIIRGVPASTENIFNMTAEVRRWQEDGGKMNPNDWTGDWMVRK